jgi:hypothetical protein
MNYHRVQENYICDASNKLINGVIRKKMCNNMQDLKMITLKS